MIKLKDILNEIRIGFTPDQVYELAIKIEDAINNLEDKHRYQVDVKGYLEILDKYGWMHRFGRLHSTRFLRLLSQFIKSLNMSQLIGLHDDLDKWYKENITRSSLNEIKVGISSEQIDELCDLIENILNSPPPNKQGITNRYMEILEKHGWYKFSKLYNIPNQKFIGWLKSLNMSQSLKLYDDLKKYYNSIK